MERMTANSLKFIDGGNVRYSIATSVLFHVSITTRVAAIIFLLPIEAQIREDTSYGVPDTTKFELDINSGWTKLRLAHML